MNNKYNVRFYRGIRKIINVPIKLLFNPAVTGIENIPNKPYILAGNHKSLFDMLLLAVYIQGEIHFMAKKELFKFKILKIFFSMLGAFPVDRNNVDIKSIKESLRILRNNEVLGIFPEGTRNKTDEIILPFKEGVTSIANKTNSLIVPFGISGKYRRNKIKLNIGEPINISQFKKEEQTKYLEEQVKKLILK